MIKAVIFDLDELMVNVLPAHLKANQAVFLELGYDIYSFPKSRQRLLIGKKIIEILKIYKDYFKIPDETATLNEIFNKREKYFMKLIKRKKYITPMKGLFKSINFLKKSFTLALVSSGTKKYINIVLNKLALDKTFKLIISGDEVKEGKPNPHCYLLAKQRLVIGDYEGLVLEDSQNGIKAAMSAKLVTVGIPQKGATYIQNQTQAHFILESLAKIDNNFIKKCHLLSNQLIKKNHKSTYLHLRGVY